MIEILFFIVYFLTVPRMLHIMQQESYQNDGMFRWIAKNPKQAFGKGFIQMIVTIITLLISSLVMILLAKYTNIFSDMKAIYADIPTLIAFVVFFYINLSNFFEEHKIRKSAKKPLKYTARVKRLIFYNFLVCALLEVFILQILESHNVYSTACIPVLYSFLVFTLPVNMIISNWFASPLETAIANRYKQKAYNILNKKEYKHLIKIGITGSYGKTSTKYILKTILEEKYNVLATPGSFNTSMGNVRVIREQLKPEHEVFISEMGARKKHDIQEICDFVRPHIGIITSIGAQHLETFKTIDNVAKTKGELLLGVKNKNSNGIEYNQYESIISIAKRMFAIVKQENNENETDTNRLLEDGAVFLNKDGGKCEELYKNDSHERKYLFSADDKDADIYAKNIKSGPEGSEFTVVSEKYKEYNCKTKLLGKHNVQNIIGAIAIAEYMGLTKEQIQSGVSKIEPVEHRLQLLPSTNGTIVIDDAFNSNPIGSKAALDVIKEFSGTKIIVTPGMVELGAEENKLNKEFGKQMADVVDYAILVGPNHTKPIQEGLKEKNFNDMNIYVVSNLDEATQKLGQITKAGDVILFENDLPDSYNE